MTFIIQYYFVTLDKIANQMYEKNPVSRMPPTGFYGYLIENT